MYRSQRIRAAAVLTAILLLAPSAGIVMLTTDRPLGAGMFTLATLIADMGVCLFLGLACMLLGYATAIAGRKRHQPQPLMGYGAALAVIVFTVALLVARFLPHGSTSDSPPDSGQSR